MGDEQNRETLVGAIFSVDECMFPSPWTTASQFCCLFQGPWALNDVISGSGEMDSPKSAKHTATSALIQPIQHAIIF